MEIFIKNFNWSCRVVAGETFAIQNSRPKGKHEQHEVMCIRGDSRVWLPGRRRRLRCGACCGACPGPGRKEWAGNMRADGGNTSVQIQAINNNADAAWIWQRPPEIRQASRVGRMAALPAARFSQVSACVVAFPQVSASVVSP